jgi:Zn-dependent alcohol dehydrogenase
VAAIRAAVCRSFDEPPAIETVELRDAGPGEVSVRVGACAICHTDLALLDGVWGGELPALYGHEVAGVVDEAGAGVVGVSPGDRVVVTLVRFCGSCPLCLRGLPALCEEKWKLPISRASPLRTTDGAPIDQGLRTGGFAEHVLVHHSQVVPIPDDMPLEVAALLGCGVVTGAGAVLRTAEVEPGSTVAVIGTGGVGLNAVQGATLAGARIVIAVDLVPEKLEKAKAFGATHTVDSGSEDLAAAVSELTAGRGLDHVVVTAGSAPAVEQALGLVADGGAVVLAGMPGGPRASIDPEELAHRGLRLLGSKVGSTRPQLDIPAFVALYRAGRLKLDELVSARFPLDRIDEAVAAARRPDAVRVLVVP